MPQLNKGGKYIFGWSIIRGNNFITFPPKVVEEYSLGRDDFFVLFLAVKQQADFV